MLIPDEKIAEVMREVCDLYLIPRFIQLGMPASGEWVENLQAEATNLTGLINGRDYTKYLVNGRAPGKRPPIAPLVEWVGNKLGIRDRSAVGIAYAIANKITKEGTDYFPNGTDLLEVIQSKEVQQYVYDRLAIYVNGQIEAQIKRALNQTFT